VNAIRATLSVITASSFLVICASTASFADDDPGKLAISPIEPDVKGQSTFVVKNQGGKTDPAGVTNGASSAWLRGSRYWTITPPSGSSGSLGGSFESYAAWSNLDTKVAFSNGYSKARWLGSSPYSLNKIGLSDRLWVTALTGVGVNVGTSGAGVSATIGSKSITMSSSRSSEWRVDHSFSGQSFTGPLFTVGENATVSAAHSYASWTYVVN
jgi:hypothetical protein